MLQNNLEINVKAMNLKHTQLIAVTLFFSYVKSIYFNMSAIRCSVRKNTFNRYLISCIPVSYVP